MKNSEAFLFGKPYRWVKGEGGLELIPDHQLSLFYPNSVARSRRMMEPKFSSELGLGKSEYDAQVHLYAQLLSPTCVRCGNPAPPFESIEVDPLCSSCVTQLSYSPMWLKIDSEQ